MDDITRLLADVRLSRTSSSSPPSMMSQSASAIVVDSPIQAANATNGPFSFGQPSRHHQHQHHQNPVADDINNRRKPLKPYYNKRSMYKWLEILVLDRLLEPDHNKENMCRLLAKFLYNHDHTQLLNLIDSAIMAFNGKGMCPFAFFMTYTVRICVCVYVSVCLSSRNSTLRRIGSAEIPCRMSNPYSETGS